MKSVNNKRITMFCGKGGVGKTTCAAATALYHAKMGRKTLAISTDPMPSLSHIFGLSNHEKPAKVGQSLYVNELGVDEVEKMWEDKFGRDVYDVFSTFVSVDYQEFVKFTASILPGLRDEFMVDYIRELVSKDEYKTIIWDTAPLGQTLALLKTPAMIMDHLKMAPRVYSKLKLSLINKESIFDIIGRWQKLSWENINFLRDEVEFTMVTIPEALAVGQIQSVFRELNKYDLSVSKLIVNNVVTTTDSEFLRFKAEQQKKYLQYIYDNYAGLEIIEVPLFPYEVEGIKRLLEIKEELFA